MGLLIEVNDDYAIRSDSRSWIVAKRRRRKGAEDWEPISWYQTLTVLRVELLARLDRECGAESQEELIAAHERHEALLFEVLDGVIETLELGQSGQGDGGQARRGGDLGRGVLISIGRGRGRDDSSRFNLRLEIV